jgi:DNA-binding Xre family transcriptional regulator
MAKLKIISRSRIIFANIVDFWWLLCYTLGTQYFIYLRCEMAASYKKLFKLMIDREIKSKDLAAKAGISPTTLAKMKKDGATVSSDVLIKICVALECSLDDIVEIVYDEC